MNAAMDKLPPTNSWYRTRFANGDRSVAMTASVRAFVCDLRGKELLGETATDEKGNVLYAQISDRSANPLSERVSASYRYM